MATLEKFYGPNAGYVLELYERYQRDPASVDAQTRAFFAQWSPNGSATSVRPVQPTIHEATDVVVQDLVARTVAASALAHAIRERGHLGAHLDPLGSPPLGDPALLPETHGITNEDLAQLPP